MLHIHCFLANLASVCTDSSIPQNGFWRLDPHQSSYSLCDLVGTLYSSYLYRVWHLGTKLWVHIIWKTESSLLFRVPKLYLTLCDPMDYSPSGPYIHGISQASILEWVVISFSRESSQRKDQIHVSCIGRRVLHHWTTWEAKSLISTVLLMASHFSILALRTPWTVGKGKKIAHWKMNCPGR